MSKKFTGRCDGCGQTRGRVLASAFNPDESFRHLCDACDRRESPIHQPKLFKGKLTALRYAVEQEVAEPEPPVEIFTAQMWMFQ